jgi:hypothetical protein
VGGLGEGAAYQATVELDVLPWREVCAQCVARTIGDAEAPAVAERNPASPGRISNRHPAMDQQGWNGPAEFGDSQRGLRRLHADRLPAT